MSSPERSPRIETVACHAGREVDPTTGAVAPPLILSTTFERAADGSLPHGNLYSRHDNPNRHALETALAALEAGGVAAAFASGQAATMSVLHALSPGDHVLLPIEMYYNTRGLLDTHYGRWGLRADYVDMTDLRAIESAMQPATRLLWVETPSNPRLFITDIAAVARLARKVGAACVVDNTWATPVCQRPLELGADLVMHSATKYFGGHGDVTGGCVIAPTPDGTLFERIRSYQGLGGAVPSPFDCWLLLRSLPTLPCRVHTQCDSATRIAEALAKQPGIRQVYYPGLTSHPGHETARRQMREFGGMLSFEVEGGASTALAVAANVRLFTRATSLGGFESLIEHRATVEGPNSPTPPGLLRCSIGLEHPDDLIADLARALRSLT